jgi:ATP-binding cassette subfamily B protein
LSALAGAAIAGHSVLPLVRAAARADRPAPPRFAVRQRRESSDRPVGLLAQAAKVVFRYRAGGEPVLNGCSLSVPHGARVLLEGASGSGKTTLVSILAGLENPDSGLLLLNGLDRSVLRTAGWRSRVVLAPQPQDNYMVGGTLAFNLLMGRRWPAPQADLAEAEQICRDLGLGELLDRMPGGLQQIVGETGWQLSQGERARVFLARALLQNPELLVLDESWGALDPENVERVARCIARRAPAVIAIAHT